MIDSRMIEFLLGTCVALLLLLLSALVFVVKRLDRLENRAGPTESTNRGEPGVTSTPRQRAQAALGHESEDSSTSTSRSTRSNIMPEMMRGFQAACKAKSKAKAEARAKDTQKNNNIATEGGGLPPRRAPHNQERRPQPR